MDGAFGGRGFVSTLITPSRLLAESTLNPRPLNAELELAYWNPKDRMHKP